MGFAFASKAMTARLVVVLFAVMPAFVAGSLLWAQEQPGAQDTPQGKTGAGDTAEAKKPARAKPGTKQAVEARLKAAEHAKPTEPIHEVEKTLFATRRFEQAVISPDGTRVAWVETLIGKDGAPSGNAAIYISGMEAKTPPKRLRAGVGRGDHEEGNVAWSPDSKRVAFLSDAVKAGQRQLYVANLSGGGGSATRAANPADAKNAADTAGPTNATNTTNVTNATGSTGGAKAEGSTNV